MFSGIIEAQGEIRDISLNGDSARIAIAAGELSMDDVTLGDSIACSGACLTVVDFDETSFSVDVSSETLKLTTIGQLSAGSAVNLEKALLVSARLGGHIVTGHIDGVGEVVEKEEQKAAAQDAIRNQFKGDRSTRTDEELEWYEDPEVVTGLAIFAATMVGTVVGLSYLFSGGKRQ